MSLKLANNLAFLVISLTMLGFAISGLVLTATLRAAAARRAEALALFGAGFALAVLGVSAVFCRVPAGSQWAPSSGAFLLAFVRLLPVALLFALPFLFAGLILGLLLASDDLPVRRIYFADLAGSAAGALVVAPAIRFVGVERSLGLAAGALALGTVLLAGARGRWARIGAAAAIAAAALVVAAPGRLFRMTYVEGSWLDAAQDAASGFVLETMDWDPVARIEVSRIPPLSPGAVPWPYLVGDDPALLSRMDRVLTQNNTAFTYATTWDGRRESLAGIRRTLYAAAYAATSAAAPRVAVVGVGGGFDVLAALGADAARVDGVEVNRATVDLLAGPYRDRFGRWLDDPRVRLHHDEGRRYLEASPATWDVLQLSGVDSASGTPAAAHVFSESYLYTEEAFDLYLSRLEPDGILNMMRMEYVPPREMLRALVTAVGALRRAGVPHPREHVAVVASRDGLFTAVLVKRSPFREGEVERLAAWAGESPFFDLAAAPGRTAARANLYAAFLAKDDAARERAFVRSYPFDIRPVTDDRPFFFRYTRWSHLLPAGASAAVPYTELGLLALLVTTGLAAVACVLAPLRFLARAGRAVPDFARNALYFAAIGLGFMAVEIALVQKFGLLLGHPNHALSVVLASLLVSAGLGASASLWIVDRLRGIRFVGYALAAILLAYVVVLLPGLRGLAPLPFAARAAVVVLLVFPVGLLLGTYFPTGLALLKGRAEAFVPWAWGLNGVASVIAPILAVAVSVTWGFELLLLAAVPAYLVAGFALPERPA